MNLTKNASVRVPKTSLASFGLLLLLLGGLGTGCSKTPPPTETDATSATKTAPPNPPSPQTSGQICDEWIAGKEALQIVADGGVLLDVRTPEEYTEGHLDGAANIPVQVLATRLDEVPLDKHIVVYCRSGKRADQAKRILKDSGRTVSSIGYMERYKAEAEAGCPE